MTEETVVEETVEETVVEETPQLSDSAKEFFRQKGITSHETQSEPEV